MSFLNWLLGKNKKIGTSFENAIIVKSVAAEYLWMQKYYKNFFPIEIEICEFNNKFYDILTWGNNEGEFVLVYFEISSFYGKQV